MALTTEQVFALGILYNKLATIVYGEDGPKANNLQNATMYPLMEIAQLILRAHTEHRITPELDRLIAQTYFTITEDDMQTSFLSCFLSSCKALSLSVIIIVRPKSIRISSPSASKPCVPVPT